MGLLTFDGPDGAQLDLIDSNQGLIRATNKSSSSAVPVPPLRGTYYVDPLFTGTQLGSESNPFTAIGTAFIFALIAGVTNGIVFLAPGANTTENVVFPVTGDWEISALQVYGVFAAKITGNVDISSTASARRALTSIRVTGNITGNCSAGTQRILISNGCSIDGSITLTTSGTGTQRLGTGSVINEFTGNGFAQNFLTGAVSVSGSFQGSAAIFGTSLAVTQNSGFSYCLMPPVTSCTGVSCTFWFSNCSNSTAGNLRFTTTGTLLLSPDLATCSEFQRTAVVTTGTVLLRSLIGRALVGTQTANVGTTAIAGTMPAGLMVCDACLTLLAKDGATAGLAVVNLTYTDASGATVVEAVTTALDVSGAVGTKARGSLPFSQNGATGLFVSVTGITNNSALSYQFDTAVRQAS